MIVSSHRLLLLFLHIEMCMYVRNYYNMILSANLDDMTTTGLANLSGEEDEGASSLSEGVVMHNYVWYNYVQQYYDRQHQFHL